MKKRIIISVAAICVLIAAVAFKSPVAMVRYGVKFATVQYSTSGVSSEKYTLYFDNYGALNAEYHEKQVQITTPEYIYTYNPATKKGTRRKNPAPPSGTYDANSDVAKKGRQMGDQMGLKKEGTEVLLGKTCDITSTTQPVTKIWMWKNVPLKMHVDLGSNLVKDKVATSIDDQTAVPAEKFKAPSDVVLTDL